MPNKDIGLSYEKGIEDLGPLKEFVATVSTSNLEVKVEEREPGYYAALEWLIPTAVIVYVGRSYFDGFLKEMGKDHYQLLKGGIKALGNWLFGPSGPTYWRVTAKGAITDQGKYSSVYSVQSEIQNHRPVKLLLRNGITSAELSESVDAFLDLLQQEQALEAMVTSHEELKGRRIQKVLLTFNSDTKSLDVVDPLPNRPGGPAVVQSNVEKAILDQVVSDLSEGQRWLTTGEVINQAKVLVWSHQVGLKLERIFGHGALRSYFPVVLDGLSATQYAAVLRGKIRDTSKLVENVRQALSSLTSPKGRVFFGHGRSPVWREFKDFVADRLALPWEEFNREATAGLTTVERLSEMMSIASFAFLVMTAEDEYPDKTMHARANVIHEIGLFQGRLGPRRAIVLLEEGCEEFSNIVGLTQIRFPVNHPSVAFEEMRKVLEREGLL